MALPVRDQLKYWGLTAAVFSLVLWFLGDVLLPFVLGGAIAYFLDPVADRLPRLIKDRVWPLTPAHGRTVVQVELNLRMGLHRHHEKAGDRRQKIRIIGIFRHKYGRIKPRATTNSPCGPPSMV